MSNRAADGALRLFVDGGAAIDLYVGADRSWQ
jgi:hypothetical protein